MKNSGSVEIDRPIEKVFELTNEHVADWSSIVVENEVLEEKPQGIGSTFRMVTEENGKRMVFHGVTTDFEPPHRSVVHMTGEMFDINAEYLFEDLSGSTRVTQNSEVTGKGMFGAFLFLFGWLMKRSSCDALDKELNGLKTFCESSA